MFLLELGCCSQRVAVTLSRTVIHDDIVQDIASIAPRSIISYAALPAQKQSCV